MSIKQIAVAAALHNTGKNGMGRGDGKGEELVKNTLIAPGQSRLCVHLGDQPISYDSFENLDPNVRLLDGGLFYIRYYPVASRKSRKKFPFRVGCDQFFEGRASLECLGDWHLKLIAKRVPEVAWMLRNTTYNPGLFTLAKKHPGLLFYFTIDYNKYVTMIEQKAEDMNLDINHSPFVARVCSYADFEKYTKRVAPARSIHDYAKELSEAELEADKENLDETE